MNRPGLLLAALAIALAAGCSGDPATSRLKPGDEAIVRRSALAEDSRPVPPPPPSEPGVTPFYIREYRVPLDRVSMNPVGDTTTQVELGAKVRVLADDRPADVRDGSGLPHPDLDGKVDRRWVKVRVLEGITKDDVGELGRNVLRPVK